MNFRNIIVDNPDYLHVRNIGAWSVETSNEGWQSIADALASSGHGRVLLDNRELELETTVGTDFKHANFVTDLLRGKCRKVAMVDIPGNSKVNGFFETVCINRGLNLQFFVREEDAIDWLMN